VRFQYPARHADPMSLLRLLLGVAPGTSRPTALLIFLAHPTKIIRS
jgi:hypothetical protein